MTKSTEAHTEGIELVAGVGSLLKYDCMLLGCKGVVTSSEPTCKYSTGCKRKKMRSRPGLKLLVVLEILLVRLCQ